MALKVRTRIGLLIAAVLGTVALAGVAVPHLIDLEAYKPAMIEAVKEATGRELVIEGPLKLTVFPTPRISATQVHFANAVGAKGAQMVDVRWVGISPSLWALLGGHVEVGRVTLYKPTIILETDAEGRPNWEFHPGAGAAQPSGAPASGMHLAVGRLRIVQGTLSYTNPRTGQALKAENIDATASVGSFDGPLSFDGTATVNNVPLSLAVSVGGPTDKGGGKGHDMALKFKVQSGTLDFDGRISRIAADADVNGKLSIATGVLTDFIAAIMRALGQPQPTFDSSVIGRFTFDGGIEVAAERLALTDFKMSMAGESVVGSVILTGGKTPSLESRLALPTLDVEKWIAVLSRPGAFQPPPAAGAAKPATPAKPAPPAASLSPFPPEFTVLLSLEAKEVVYRKGAVRDLVVAVEIRKGVIAVPQLSAVLPGEMVLHANAAPTVAAAPPAKPAANAVQSAGEISLTGPKLRETLAWLGIDTSGIPADKLRTLAVKGKLASTATSLQMSDLAFDLDGLRATGSGSVTVAVPLTVATSLQVDRFDLDAYMPKPAAAPAFPVAPAMVAPAAPAPPDRNAPVLGLKAKVAKLVYRGETLNGVDADLAMQGNLLKLNGLKVADLLGAKLDLKGQVADFGSQPRFDVTFNASMPDTDKLAVYAGLPKFINGKMGASTASGGVAGTMDALALRNASVTLAGATATATGSLVLGDKFAFDFSSFALQAQEASRIVSLATGGNQTGLGAIDATGAFKGNEQRVSFDGNLAAMGAQMAGHIEATLGERPNIVANLRVPGTLDFDNWLGVADGPAPAVAQDTGGAAAAPPVQATPARAATGKAIDLSGLRAFDATLNLETSAIQVAALKVTYADMNATLKNGVFKISKLTGQFYGGAVDFTGTVDASKAAMTVDMAGTLQGIYLGEMLRGTAGSNVFGNDHLMVAIDGKISIMELAVQGQGTSPEQIRDSLNGRGHLTGTVYPSVAKGSLSFASFATGVASIFSTEMGFSSAVLASFINNQSRIEGTLSLAGGVLTLQDHTVQGQNAVALINSRTSLTQATTETTITLDTGTRGRPDYVMTVKGPVSSPTMSTGRGPGN